MSFPPKKFNIMQSGPIPQNIPEKRKTPAKKTTLMLFSWGLKTEVPYNLSNLIVNDFKLKVNNRQ